jgi:hypothetical protein
MGKTFTLVQQFGNPTFNSLTVSGSIRFTGDLIVTGSVTGTSFSGAGTGLTGTASSLSIGGNALTATTSTNVASPDGDRNPSTKLPTTNPRNVRFDFATAGSVTGATGNYAGVMTYAPWDGTSISTGDSSYQLAFCNFSGINASGLPGLALRNGINSTWNSTWYQVLHSGNYTSYAPSLIGAGASGNWGINITGNAATATSATTAGNITAYTINQNVGTGNSPSFVAVSLSGNLTVSTGNTTGGGIILADDGDIVDLNDAFCSMRFSSGVRIFSANRGGSAVIKLGNGGDIVASSDITAYGSPSDISLKENIKPLNNSLSKILKLQGVTFDWKEDSETRQYTNLKEDIGFIAQQVQEIIPELVRQNNNGLLSLRDRGLTALLVEAIKEQQAQIEELKAKIG